MLMRKSGARCKSVDTRTLCEVISPLGVEDGNQMRKDGGERNCGQLLCAVKSCWLRRRRAGMDEGPDHKCVEEPWGYDRQYEMDVMRSKLS